MGDGAGVAAQERSGQLAYTEWRGVKHERERSKTIFLLESIPSLPVALILSSLLGHQIPSLKSCCHANARLQSTRGGLECWRQSCFVSPTSPLCLCGGGTLRVPIAPWNALICYNLLYYLWKQKRASLCAGRLPCQPCRLVSSSLFLPIWLVLARLPFRCSRPIVALSRWHLCGWCAALRGSPINIRYTHAGAHTLRLWHTSTFQLTWNTFGAVCCMSDVMPHVISAQWFQKMRATRQTLAREVSLQGKPGRREKMGLFHLRGMSAHICRHLAPLHRQRRDLRVTHRPSLSAVALTACDGRRLHNGMEGTI